MIERYRYNDNKDASLGSPPKEEEQREDANEGKPEEEEKEKINVFNPRMSLVEVRKWFIQLAESNSKNGKPFLTVEQVEQFIERAFVGNTSLEKLTFNYSSRGKTYFMEIVLSILSELCKY